MASTLNIPKFSSEAEEADWWYDHREAVEQNLCDAIDQGRTGRGTVMRLALEADATIKLDADDASRARAAAGRKGMPYQAYVKMLVHEALDRQAEAP